MSIDPDRSLDCINQSDPSRRHGPNPIPLCDFDTDLVVWVHAVLEFRNNFFHFRDRNRDPMRSDGPEFPLMDESLLADDDECDRNCDNIEAVGDVSVLVVADTDDYYCSKRFSVEMMKDDAAAAADLLNDVVDYSHSFQRQRTDPWLRSSR